MNTIKPDTEIEAAKAALPTADVPTGVAYLRGARDTIRATGKRPDVAAWNLPKHIAKFVLDALGKDAMGEPLTATEAANEMVMETIGPMIRCACSKGVYYPL